MKLNYKRTFLVGLAFFSISAFWQLYDAVIPLILGNTYMLDNKATGFIMGLDNLLALFLLPLFGALSDKKGARMPFIALGTVLAVVLMIFIPILDNNYTAMNHAQSLLLFFLALGALLVSMGIYRSPAVALMADVTPKPVRSQGNAVINLMGAFGGIYTLAMIKVAVVKNPDDTSNYFFLFLSVALLMAAAIGILYATLREKKLVQEMKDINYGVPPEEDQGRAEIVDGKEKLPAPVFKSLLLILCTIGLWFLGYNAVTTFFTKYADATWSGGLSHASTCLMVATGAAVLSYMPISFLSSRLGRKNMIRIGLLVAAACFAFATFYAGEFTFSLYIVFAVVGFAQASVTVNTFPMVWEISRVGNVGKYTGFYYTVSMAVQTVTPFILGVFLDWLGYSALFPYGFVFVLLALIPISFAKHGDSKPIPPTKKLEAFDVDD
ncbi:MAG TPA: MFS transporter [Clostridia bacterium]|nr:MFS transporter [Clostridia bacterium]